MPSVSLRLTDAQVSWLDAQTRQFRNRSDVMRDLIDSQMGNLDSPITLGTASTEGAKPLPSNTLITKETPISNNTPIGGSKGETAEKDAYAKKTLGDDLIPDDLFKSKTTRTPDKTAIKAALKGGQEIVGARLVQRTNWSIK